MERDEEDAVVFPEDRVRAVPVVDVEIDDRHSLKADALLGRTCGDRDVVEEAEPHRSISQSVVAGRPDESESSAQRGLDRGARSERGGVERRRRADGVGVEPDRFLDRADDLDMLGGVAEQQLLLVAARPSLQTC